MEKIINMKRKTKNPGDRVLIQFANDNQAETFFEWFKKYGYDELQTSDYVHDNLAYEEQYNCISADEYPGATSDEKAYFIEIE